MARRSDKQRARLEKQRLEPGRAALERAVRARFPDAEVRWEDGDHQPTLRIEGVERQSFDELQQLLVDANVQPADSWSHLAALGVSRWVVIEPEAMELYRRDTARDRAVRRVSKGFDLIQLLVPKRIADEEIGDALETIARLAREERPKWQIYLKAASVVFFVLLNAVREISGSLLGKRKKA